jgi:hypothetical protein
VSFWRWTGNGTGWYSYRRPPYGPVLDHPVTVDPRTSQIITPPAPPVLDDFNRADSAGAGLGANWTAILGTIDTVSNTAATLGTGENQALWATPMGGPDHTVSGTNTFTGTGGSGIMFRASSDGSSFYLANVETTQVQLYKYLSGGFTAVGSPGPVDASGSRITVSAQGSAIKVYDDGALIIDLTDSSITTGNYVGLRIAGSTTITWDDFDATSIPSTSAPAETPSAVGTAGNATASVGANAEQPTATGTAHDAAPSLGVPAGAVTAAATAADAAASVAVNAEQPSAVAAAYDATVTTTSGTSPDAELVAGTGTAYDAQAAVGANAGTPTGVAAAHDGAASLGVQAGQAAAAGAALDAFPGLGVQAGAATASGAAQAAQAALTANAGAVAATGAAYDATVSVSGSTSAPAESAFAVAVAYDATVLTGGTPVTADAETVYAVATVFDATVITAVATVIYLFRTPLHPTNSVPRGTRGPQLGLMRHYAGMSNRGVAVLIVDGQVVERRNPDANELAAASHVFLGGHENVVTDAAIADLLTEAGYELIGV